MKTIKRYAIVALNKHLLIDDIKVLNKMGFIQDRMYIGSYKGVRELSYRVPISDIYSLEVLLDMAFNCNQESILYLRINELNETFAIIVPTNRDEPYGISGKWVNVGVHQPKQDAWTKDIETGDYYIIK